MEGTQSAGSEGASSKYDPFDMLKQLQLELWASCAELGKDRYAVAWSDLESDLESILQSHRWRAAVASTTWVRTCTQFEMEPSIEWHAECSCNLPQHELAAMLSLALN